MAEACPYHLEHETRMKNLEVSMKEAQGEIKDIKEKQTNPALWVALFGVVGTMVSTIGAFCGVVAVAYFKSQGLMP